MPEILTTQRRVLSSRLVVRFILVAGGVYAAALSLAWGLIRFVPTATGIAEVVLPRAFLVSTLFLAAGSLLLARAGQQVRIERQRAFRRSLLGALVAGVLFVGVQSYGLACLIRHQDPQEVQTGVNAFVTVFAALHAAHFALALLFLIWITLNALADRYDHEYYWGVTVCAWFWHALGVVWGLILVVFFFATR